ncbi:hypothetical protein [Kitasatospora sp. NPDC087271]|uniref:hypothetical protein n=1 Tax=Kitasatospora sp. NPDC087271 TaxID=3364067 RepID=UPI003826C24A
MTAATPTAPDAALVHDSRTGRLGVVMDLVAGLLHLRPPHGGVEWTARPEDIGPPPPQNSWRYRPAPTPTRPHPALVAAAAFSIATGAGAGALASRPLRHSDPGMANLFFLLVLCVVTVLVNSALSKAIQHRRTHPPQEGEP